MTETEIIEAKARADKHNTDHWNSMKEDFAKHENELVLYFNEVVRFVGIENVPDDDFFYEFETFGGGKVSPSCLIGYSLLKGNIPDDDYDRMQSIWDINRPFWPNEPSNAKETLRFVQTHESRCEHPNWVPMRYDGEYFGPIKYNLCLSCGRPFDEEFDPNGK
jgi:hypothetical protein